MTIQPDGRVVIPLAVRKITKIQNSQGFCQVENIGEDKVLLTILNRWKPNPRIRGPGRTMVKE